MIVWSHIRDALFELDALLRYRHLTLFSKVDWYLKKHDLISNAYAECRRYFGKEEAEGIYGETPLQTIEALLEGIGITKEDTFVDLGCGRGRLCFFVHSRFGCAVKGIDLVPRYIATAGKYASQGIEFVVDDYKNHISSMGQQISTAKRTIFYWYSITSSESRYYRLVDQFQKGALVITISEPIKGWELLSTQSALFSWGETHAYIQRKPYDRSSKENV